MTRCIILSDILWQTYRVMDTHIIVLLYKKYMCIIWHYLSIRILFLYLFKSVKDVRTRALYTYVHRLDAKRDYKQVRKVWNIKGREKKMTKRSNACVCARAWQHRCSVWRREAGEDNALAQNPRDIPAAFFVLYSGVLSRMHIRRGPCSLYSFPRKSSFTLKRILRQILSTIARIRARSDSPPAPLSLSLIMDNLYLFIRIASSSPLFDQIIIFVY